MALAAPPAGSDLCTQCGLCCNGALFGFVPLTEEEQARPRHHGHGARMPQPCEFLDGRTCGIYADGPPQVCSVFRCRLLRRFEAGELSLDDALVEVAEGHRLHDTARAELEPDTQLADVYRELAEGAAAQEEAFDMSKARRQVALITLMVYAQDHFRVPGDAADRQRTNFPG